MRTLAQIKNYLEQLKQERESISEVIEVSMETFTHVTTPQQFVGELQSKRNLASHHDATRLQELKNGYNTIITYANEDESVTKENWETQEVIQWLINDASVWNVLRGQDVKDIEDWVKQGNAPDGLYRSFREPPVSSLNQVDWQAVAESLAEEN